LHILTPPCSQHDGIVVWPLLPLPLCLPPAMPPLIPSLCHIRRFLFDYCVDHTLPFWKQSLHHCHPPTTPNDPSPPGYCQHSNSCGNCLRTREDTSNLVQGPAYTFQTHTAIFLVLEDHSLTYCHNTTSSHNAPSLTTLSSCPTPPPDHRTPDI